MLCKLHLQLTLSKHNKILRIRNGANCKSDETAPSLTTLWGLCLCVCVSASVCAHNVSLIATFRKATALTNWMSLGQLGQLPGTGRGRDKGWGRGTRQETHRGNQSQFPYPSRGDEEREIERGESGRGEGKGAWHALNRLQRFSANPAK